MTLTNVSGVRWQATTQRTPSRSGVVLCQHVEAVGTCGVKQRDLAVFELFTTEQSHVDGLQLLQSLYAVPLEHSGVISESDWHLVFGHVEVLHNTHSTLLAKLREKIDRWSANTTIGDVLLQMAPYLSVYTQYVSQYDAASAKAHELIAKNKVGFQLLLLLFCLMFMFLNRNLLLCVRNFKTLDKLVVV